MLECQEQDGSITFMVRVVVRASQSGISGEHDGALRVRVHAPPVENAANDELRRTLSRAFKVSGQAVEIISGQSSKLKRVRVWGVRCAQLESLAAGQ